LPNIRNPKCTICRQFNSYYSREFYDDDITVTSFINIKHCNVATEILRNEQWVVIVFLWAKKINANEIYFQMHPVYMHPVATSAF